MFLIIGSINPQSLSQRFWITLYYRPCVYLCVCMSVWMCVKFYLPSTISKPVIRLIRNFDYVGLIVLYRIFSTPLVTFLLLLLLLLRLLRLLLLRLPLLRLLLRLLLLLVLLPFQGLGAIPFRTKGIGLFKLILPSGPRPSYIPFSLWVVK